MAQHADWAASIHAHAHDSEAFSASFARARDPWCHSCHLPETGVDCASCHRSGRTCASCHQFDLPGSQIPSQDTAREHARSSFADRPCATCHDPHEASAGAHDQVAFRRSLTVVVEPDGDGSIARLTSHGVGHALPTGDPFRRLVLELCADLRCSRVVGSHVLQRTMQEGPEGWAEDSDTRIPPPTDGPDSTIELRLPPARSWRLWYRLTDPRHLEVTEDQWLVDAGLIRTTP